MNLNLNQSRRETPRCVGAGAGAAALLLYVNVCEWFTVTTLKGAHCTHDRRAAHAAGQGLVSSGQCCLLPNAGPW